MERDIPKYLRSTNNWVKDLQSATSGDVEGGDPNTSYQRDSIEDLLQVEETKSYTGKSGVDPLKDYEPVLYEVVKDPSASFKDREGLSSI